jgi:hypothetical protein
MSITAAIVMAAYYTFSTAVPIAVGLAIYHHMPER